MLKRLLAQASLTDLIAFRDALTRYIEARLYEDDDTEMLEKAREELAALEAALAEQTAVVTTLRQQLMGSNSEGQDTKPVVDVVPVTSDVPKSNHNGHSRTIATVSYRNRKHMCALLGISKATLTRWARAFAAHLSSSSREDYLFTPQDEHILLKVKALREQNHDTAYILRELERDNSNRIA